MKRTSHVMPLFLNPIYNSTHQNFDMQHEGDSVSFQAWNESINIIYDVDAVESISYDLFGRKMFPKVNNTLYIFLYDSMQYLAKRMFIQNPGCANLDWGCSRIHVQYEFRERFEIVNKQTSFIGCIIAIGASLTIVKLIYNVIQQYFLANQYRNYVGKRVREADELRTIEQQRKRDLSMSIESGVALSG